MVAPERPTLLSPATEAGRGNVHVPEGDKFPRAQEAQVCAGIAQAEGDRLFQALGPGGTCPAAEACWRIAAVIRQRLDSVLAPF